MMRSVRQNVKSCLRTGRTALPPTHRNARTPMTTLQSGAVTHSSFTHRVISFYDALETVIFKKTNKYFNPKAHQKTSQTFKAHLHAYMWKIASFM